MAPIEGKPLFYLRKGDTSFSGDEMVMMDWSYMNQTRTPGAFRAISVKHLRKPYPKIKLYEWPDLRYPSSKAKEGSNYPAYAAISHVWKESDEVRRIANAAQSDLVIATDGDTHTISWLGLQEAANAAHQYGCTHIWLDLTCMDQVPRPDPIDPLIPDDGEKQLQINNMNTIYTHAKMVIVMVGGVSAVQGVNYSTGWMDRAWTLQEAVSCYKQTWAYVYWPYQRQFTYNAQKFKFFPVPGETDKCLIKLLQLLEIPNLSSPAITPPLKLPTGFKVKCLDGCATGLAVGAARAALLTIFKAKNEEWRRSGIWRSMLLRTSTVPADIAYSVMGLFGVQLDPYRKERDLQYLFNDLATKTGAKGSPGWLGVGGLGGSLILRYPRSGLIPYVPINQGDELPVYDCDGELVLSGELVDRSQAYISRYDIKFITSSLPHIVCARMFQFSITNGPVKFNTNQYRVFLSIGTCTYRGEIGQRFVIVGTIKSWSTSSSYYNGALYILFVSWDYYKPRWSVTGDGYLRLNGTSRLSQARIHFTIGWDSPDIKTWPCDHKVNTMHKILPRSYGILPRPDLSIEKRIPIKWMGYKGQDVTMFETWYTFNVYSDGAAIHQASEMGQKLPIFWPLYLVTYNSPNPPEYPDEAPPNSLLKYNKISMQYTEIDLKLGSLDQWLDMAGAQPPAVTPLTYLATVQFRQNVVYLIMERDKDTDPDFRRIAVAGYRMKGELISVPPTTFPQSIPILQPQQQFDQSRIFFPNSPQQWDDLYNRMGATGDIADFIARMKPRFGFRE